MSRKLSCVLAGAAFVLVAESARFALADPMFHDSNTGLPITIYNAPLCELQAQGLPLSEFARNYMRARPGLCDDLRPPGSYGPAKGALPGPADRRQSRKATR